MSLEKLREQLSELDLKLLTLIGERQRIVGDIGRDKRASGQATRDYQREKVVLGQAREQADAVGIDPNLAEEIMSLLIKSSLTNQERDRVAAEGQGNGRSVLVIGGAGKMGAWFVDFFRSQGFATDVADKQVRAGAGLFENWTDAGIDYDIIVVATPLAISAEILLALAKLEPQGLIFDIGSLKTPLRAGLNALADAGCKVTSLHPMYGPGTELLSGRHLIFVDAGNPEATAEARKLFAATMVEQLNMEIDDHDRLIAYVLGLSHALNIAFVNALAESGEAAPQLAKLSSTTFDSQLLVAAAVTRDNPHLYFEIQNLNEYGLGPLEALCQSTSKLHSVVAGGDESGFVDLMEKGRAYLEARG
jgi:chorismate mutase/prephenate dehydrogenase